jgi:hypothetical protein
MALFNVWMLARTFDYATEDGGFVGGGRGDFETDF